uniref:Uncharacterized protein LOC111099466 n=1 Tax=Crassostrea virginica TaxID=6565 RepID=A0A8B8A732_CRAVI|nr:uncharacterized protein LOC111099466 [Crassostrea virginica]
MESVHDNYQVAKAINDSCSVSRKVYKNVERCPVTKNELMISAQKMNCSSFARQCGEPERLMYHCVINPSGGLVEVCAYTQSILYGRCTEYSISGNLIQGNDRIPCNQCPTYYPSNHAYKYPECYRLQETTETTQQVTSSTTLQKNNATGDTSGQHEPNSIVMAIFAALAICVIIFE